MNPIWILYGSLYGSYMDHIWILYESLYGSYMKRESRRTATGKGAGGAAGGAAGCAIRVWLTTLDGGQQQL